MKTSLHNILKLTGGLMLSAPIAHAAPQANANSLCYSNSVMPGGSYSPECITAANTMNRISNNDVVIEAKCINNEAGSVPGCGLYQSRLDVKVILLNQ